MKEKFLIVVVGPTAVGKTALSLNLAQHFNTEIISADSRQFFRELNIGTAKPSTSDLKKVKHHFINSLSIHDEYNAGHFEKDAMELIENLFIKKDVLVLAGGSGLYVNLVLHGMDAVPPSNIELRKELVEQYNEKGIVFLQEKLKELDPDHFNKSDIKNPNRLIRAIEVSMITGKPYSENISQKKIKRNFIPVIIGLDIERKVLYSKINSRVDTMISEGLKEEVSCLLPFKNLNALQTVGYREIIQHLEGKLSLEKAIDLIKQNTRNYAKRQLTWFRKMENINWLEPDDMKGIMNLIASKIT